MRKFGLIVVAVALVACSKDADEMPLGPTDEVVAEFGFGHAGAARYRVTVANLSQGQPFTPPLAATHRPPAGIFAVGSAASAELQDVAENGRLGPLVTALEGNDHVADVVVALGSPPPILPGTSRSFYIDSDQGAKWISLVSMLICTNDGFTGVDSYRLPKDVGDSVTLYRDAYDAGTEDNTEAWADLVPPCAMVTGFGDQGGTDASNPAIAEDDVVRLHPNIGGAADLQIDPHAWSGAIARITIARVQ